MKTLLRYLRKFTSTIRALSAPQRILYAGSLIVLFGSLAFLVYAINKTDYIPLYSRLSDEDLGRVVQTLKVKKISYQLSGNNGIAVPKDALYEVRLALATDGVLKGAGVGFEIFDEQKLGSTEFVQKINYQRALQGELARTINQLEEVLESRVHLVLPAESLFVEDQKPPSAAVVLKLQPGANLQSQQIQGIVNLVASAVSGLEQDKVTVISTDGQVLFKKSALDNSFQMTQLQTQFKSSVEEDLRQKVQSMLAQVVGANRVMTRVAADLDFSQIQVSEETYDPDSAVVRSQQRSTENTQGGELSAKGNPDVPINVESQLMQSPAPQGGAQKASNRQKETVNYEINRISRQIIHAPGSIRKLSVAVVLDGPYEMKANEAGKTQPVFVGHTSEQLKSLEDIVKKAVGYDEVRGDQITISNIPFAADTPGTELVQVENRWVKLLRDNQKILLNLLLTVLAFFFIVRPFMRKFQQMGENVGSLPESNTAALPGEREKAYPGLTDARPEAEISLRQQSIALIQQNPERAAEIIRTLLREEN